MQATLPEKYYLDHALELFGFIRQHCDHLLEEQHRQYLQRYFDLGDDARCRDLLPNAWTRNTSHKLDIRSNFGWKLRPIKFAFFIAVL